MRVPIVLDNLIHRGEMPITIGVFVDPGEPYNRNAEYDAFDDAYATFLLTEILPNVAEPYRIADDPDQWAICGGSAGSNCALTVAWLRPDRFRRVASFSGSFVQIEGGNPYLNLIPKTPRKPLRIFLQAATHDLYFNEAVFNWYSTNLRVAAALAERGYDVRLVLGDGDHSPAPGNHGAAILPDTLRPGTLAGHCHPRRYPGASSETRWCTGAGTAFSCLRQYLRFAIHSSSSSVSLMTRRRGSPLPWSGPSSCVSNPSCSRSRVAAASKALSRSVAVRTPYLRSVLNVASRAAPFPFAGPACR
jgi:hypothetical protein